MGRKDTKPVLAVEYIHDTFQRCLDAANSRSEEPSQLPVREKYIVRTGEPTLKRSAPSDSDGEVHGIRRKRRKLDFDAVDGFAIDPKLPDMEPFPEDVRLEYIPPLCVNRASPLVCVNQDIVRSSTKYHTG